MARYKGRLSAKNIERDHPHMVEIVVPPNGLGRRLDDMYEWHRARGIEAQRGRWRREDGRDYVSWCFAEAEAAAAFKANFT